MSAGRLLPCGPEAFLAEYSSIAEVIAVARRVTGEALDDVIDVVPAARTVLVTVRPSVDRDLVRSLLLASVDTTAAPERSSTVEIEVRYEGIDLEAVAHACGLTVDDVVDLHSAAQYTVAFCGFRPGFAYLVGLDQRLILPRRATPRPRVHAGTVAIASEYTAVYPSTSPGGWHLLGTTAAVLWDDGLDPPALLPPGTNVRFVRR
ncbi:MAG: 5-oxoprolinase subunit PxpB [Actinomycetota bacterium]